MTFLGIAVWLITSDKKVLLQLKNWRGKTFLEPIKGWVRRDEATNDRIRKQMEEALGCNFAKNFPFFQLSQIAKIEFSIKGKGSGVRYHFFGSITPEKLSLIPIQNFKLIGKSDLSSRDFYLFDEDHRILSEILLD